MRRKKLRPDGTTLQACCRWPSNENRSRFVHTVFAPHWFINDCSLVSLSAGSLISIFSVSISIPRNTKAVDGPSVLCPATGIPTSLHTLKATCSASAHSGDPPFRQTNSHRGNEWPFAPHCGPSSILRSNWFELSPHFLVITWSYFNKFVYFLNK